MKPKKTREWGGALSPCSQDLVEGMVGGGKKGAVVRQWPTL